MQFSPQIFSQLSKPEKTMRILQAALNAADPWRAIHRELLVSNSGFQVGECNYCFDEYNHIYLAGIGKAVLPMARGINDLLGERIESGYLIAKHMDQDQKCLPPKYQIHLGSHPIPDEQSILAGRGLIHFLRQVSNRDILLCLISGGGSALMTVPVPGIELDDIRKLTRMLLECGAAIIEINAIRSVLDILKGGGLAQMIQPAQTVSLILSDVIGDRVDMIASGPTSSTPPSWRSAVEILRKYSLWDRCPERIRLYLELQKANLPLQELFKREFQQPQNLVIASNRISLDAAMEQAAREGFATTMISDQMEGEASEVGLTLSRKFSDYINQGRLKRPVMWVGGGETTVTIRGNGKGGRNQELALAAVEPMAGLVDVALITLATDGEDGPTDAAGAIVTGDTYARGKQNGMISSDYLAINNSYEYFDQLNSLIRLGPTGTNVNDLCFLFAYD